MKWFASITALSLVLGMSYGALANDGRSAGTSSANTVLQRFGTKEGLRQNLAVPMTNAGTNMMTIDGSGSFSAALGIPSSNKFLQVLIQPSGTGDLSTVIVAQDLNSDGSFDHSFSLGAPVSGVCANGFISCAPGTWNSCQPYTWKSDETGRLSIESAGITQLGGCYCINSSCGQNLVWTNSAIVLKDLGGGAVGAIHGTDTSVMITDVRTDITTITYYGQLLRQAASGTNQVQALSAVPSAPQAQAYYGNWPQLSADSGTMALTQGGDPYSMYSQVVSASVKADSRNCTINRNGQSTTTPVSLSSTGQLTFGAPGTSDAMFAKITQDATTSAYTFWLAGGEYFGGMAIGFKSIGWFPVTTINIPPPSATSQWKLTTASFYSNFSGAGCSSGTVAVDALSNGLNTPVAASARCPTPGNQYPTANWGYLFEYKQDSYQEGVDNQCANLETDSTCRLKSEIIDNVVAVQNYNFTRLKQLPSCKTFPGQGQNLEVCREWWQKKRTYVCENRPFDFSDVKKRYTPVVSTSVDTGSALNYSDVRKDTSGNWITGQASITLPAPRDAFSECEQACKVRRPKTDSQIGVTGIMSENRATNLSHDDLYKICSDGGTSCPVDAGETIIDNCRCVNQFAEAASIMQTLRLAGADNICSSGKPVPPK